MALYPLTMAEEDLKVKVWNEWFAECEYSTNGKVDFELKIGKDKNPLGLEEAPLLWAEAKKGRNHDIVESFVQLILTIGRYTGSGRIIDETLNPQYLGAFDAEKIAFVPLDAVIDIFDKNDFDWTVTPSDHASKEFKEIQCLVKDSIDKSKSLYNFEENKKELKNFIKNGIIGGGTDGRQQITSRNFVRVFHIWEKRVLPSINIDWKRTKGILPRDFFLADLLSQDGKGLVENLFVILNSDKYILKLHGDALGLGKDAEICYFYKDKQEAYNAFWNIYKRPPKKQFWDTIMERVDLLVPVDVRERKGAFFTPEVWVEKSQQYLADVLGSNWQDGYYIWDCCAGTGNLEVGLKKPLRVWVSTLDESDVRIMRELCRESKQYAKEHIFQFDFLNGGFEDLPESLKNVLKDPQKRKHLIIYINPPYAEATNAKTSTGTGKNKSGVATQNKICQESQEHIGKASNELFALFFYRIYKEIQGCILAEFSTLKILQGSSFKDFRKFFKAELKKLFIVPASSFDNVNGDFPIGFFIWDTSQKVKFNSIQASVFEKGNVPLGQKTIQISSNSKSINKWAAEEDIAKKNEELIIGYQENPTPDFQNNKFLNFTNNIGTRHNNYFAYAASTMFSGAVYFAVRECIEHTWLNDRDQFLAPQKSWKADKEFQNDCLMYALFHGQNRITSKNGTNHWIPFTEEEVNVVEEFESHFMTDFINGRIRPKGNLQPEFSFDGDCYNGFKMVAEEQASYSIPLEFSKEALEVKKAGLALWRYYHSRQGQGDDVNFPYNVNASLYDIREHFQGRNEKGKMNKDSKDDIYMKLIQNLRTAVSMLGDKISDKVYEHGFLLR